MAEYDNTNRGVLFRQKEKKQDTHPDYEGNLNVEGVDFWIKGWIKEKKDGSGKFLSLSVKPKQARPPQNDLEDDGPTPPAQPAPNPEEDDIPF